MTIAEAHNVNGRSGQRSRRPLAALLGADLVSQTGNMLTWVAIPWYVLETTDNAALAGVTAATEAVAVVIAGVLGGAVVDRLGQKRTSIIGDLASAATVAMIPTLHHTVGWPSGTSWSWSSSGRCSISRGGRPGAICTRRWPSWARSAWSGPTPPR